MYPIRIECFVENFPDNFPNPGKHYAYAVCDNSGFSMMSRHQIKDFDELIEELTFTKNNYFTNQKFVRISNNVPRFPKFLQPDYAQPLEQSELEQVIKRINSS